MLGKNFSDDLAAAGLAGLPISWGDDGTIHGRENLTPEQDAALDTVIAAHVPAAPPRIITYAAFEDRFTDTEADAIAALSLQNATVHRVVTRAAASNSIDLNSERLALFMAALVQTGIINEARSAEILGE